jgi:selenocysteine lyase/cysteine desulfurase
VHERAAGLAEMLAENLASRGVGVLERGRSTLVSWRVADPLGEVDRLAAAGFVTRSIPSAGLVRASVGAWSSEEELERLVGLVAPA